MKFFLFCSTLFVLCICGSVKACFLQAFNFSDLRKYNYVIVPGFLNEIGENYMSDYHKYLADAGVPKYQVLQISNSSFQDLNTSGEVIYDKSLSHFNNNKKIIFLAHSKGALETLMALSNFPIQRLKRAFLIQGPMRGFRPIELLFFKDTPYYSKLVNSFNPNTINDMLGEILSDYWLRAKITFVRSKSPLKKTRLHQRLLGTVYKYLYKKTNDGIIPFEDQIPLRYSNRICDIQFSNVHHGTFTSPGTWEEKMVIKKFLNFLFFTR